MSHFDHTRAALSLRSTALAVLSIVLVFSLLAGMVFFPREKTSSAFAAESSEAETLPEEDSAEEATVAAVEEAEPVEDPAADADTSIPAAAEEEEAKPEEAPPAESTDTTPPSVKYAAAAVTLGSAVTPSTFVIHYEDENSVSFRFEEKPDTSKLGEYPITLIAEDPNGNQRIIKTKLYVCDRVINLEYEVRSYTGLQLREKLGTMHGYKPSIQQLKVTEEGAAAFDLKKGDTLLYIGVHIRDTTRPKVKAAEQICYLGYPREPEEFITSVTDQQDVTIEYLSEPDWETPGEREVKIAVTDASYNRTVAKVTCPFKQDDIPPKVNVNLAAFHYVGDAVAYMKGVIVTDNLDPACEVSVDKSAVKYRKVGTYPVTYTATDRDGNSSSVTVEITFREPSVTDEQLDELAESILQDILKDDMSVAKKIRAIYDYCRYKIRYTGDSDKTDWKGEAYRGLTEFKGDCFTYYSAAFLLLNKIDGVEVMSVERIDGITRHYWCLVNIGTGWYHYDACPNHIYGTCFMRTNSQLHNGEGRAYWKFDQSLFPEVATKSFKMF